MEDTIRVSAAGLADIVIDERHFLLLHKNSLEKGKVIYKPVGGAIEYHDPAREYLESIGAHDFEKGKDLRFRMPKKNWTEFIEWFQSEKERDVYPLKELEEELVYENRILPEFDPEAVKITKMGEEEERKESNRTGQERNMTYRVFEVFRADFNKQYTEALRSVVAAPRTGPPLAILARKDEIKDLRTRRDEAIGDNSLCFLNYS